jgi:hypothetical protein
VGEGGRCLKWSWAGWQCLSVATYLQTEWAAIQRSRGHAAGEVHSDWAGGATLHPIYLVGVEMPRGPWPIGGKGATVKAGSTREWTVWLQILVHPRRELGGGQQWLVRIGHRGTAVNHTDEWRTRKQLSF